MSMHQYWADWFDCRADKKRDGAVVMNHKHEIVREIPPDPQAEAYWRRRAQREGDLAHRFTGDSYSITL